MIHFQCKDELQADSMCYLSVCVMFDVDSIYKHHHTPGEPCSGHGTQSGYTGIPMVLILNPAFSQTHVTCLYSPILPLAVWMKVRSLFIDSTHTDTRCLGIHIFNITIYGVYVSIRVYVCVYLYSYICMCMSVSGFRKLSAKFAPHCDNAL